MPDYPRIPLAYERPTPEDQRNTLEALRRQLVTRRSVRDFSPDPVPLDLIENAIRVAASAPSGANQQPWTFVVIGDPMLKAQIREAAEQEERESYAHRMSPEWLEALAPLGTDWQKPHLTQAPWVIVVFEQLYGLRIHDDFSEEKVLHYYTRESVGIAVGFLLAALHVAGLATLTHTPSPMRFLNRYCDRPRNERPYVVIPVGYPAPGCTVPEIEKKTLEQVMRLL